MPRAIDLMKKREDEILKIILYISEKTDGFTNPKLIIIGGYALRAFIKFSRYTRDCDFILKKKDGWHLDNLNRILPEDWKIEDLKKQYRYGFMRWLKFIKYDKVRIKVSIDFMEGEIRGRKEEEIIMIDNRIVENSRFTLIPIAGQEVKAFVPEYLDYFIMKVISCRASDIRDIASLIHENAVPRELEKRINEIVPNPELFESKVRKRIIPEMKKRTFIDSWKGIMGTAEFTEKNKEQIVKRLEELLRTLRL